MPVKEDNNYVCKNCEENVLLIVGDDNQVLVCPVCDRPEETSDEAG